MTWLVAGKISCICYYDSEAKAAFRKRCSAVWPVWVGEGGEDYPWWITVFFVSSSPPQPPDCPVCSQSQSQASLSVCWVCWCHWLRCSQRNCFYTFLSSLSPLNFQLFCLFSFLNIHLSSLSPAAAFIVQQVTSHILLVNPFFSDLAGFSGFFFNLPREPVCLTEWWHTAPQEQAQ